MNQKEYAAHCGVSQPQISKWIRQGILKKSIKKVGRGYTIDEAVADRERQQNLDPARGGDRTGKKNKKASRAKSRKSKKSGEPAAIPDGGGEVISRAGLSVSMDFNAARTVREQYAAANLKLDYDIRKGTYVLIADVERHGFEAGKMIKDHCQSIPERCAALVASESDIFKCKQIMAKEINIVLENLSAFLMKFKRG